MITGRHFGSVSERVLPRRQPKFDLAGRHIQVIGNEWL